MLKLVSVRGSRGLNKLREAQRYLVRKPVGTTDDIWLTEALNVYVDSDGMIKRRPGYQQADSSSYHSPFKAGDFLYIVKDGVLGYLDENLDFSPLYSPVRSNVAYCQANDLVYATDGSFIIGLDGPNYFEPQVPQDPRFATMPPGQCLACFNNRLYVASGNIIYVSEPMNFDIYHKPTGWVLAKGKVTMLWAVDDGLYVSDEDGVWFLSGVWPELTRKNLTRSRAILGAVARVSKRYLPSGVDIGCPFVFATSNGLCIGGNGGVFAELTKDRYPSLSATRAGMAFVRLEETVDGQVMITPQVVLLT